MSTAGTIDQERFDDAMNHVQQSVKGIFGVMVQDLDSEATLTYHHQDVFPTASTMKTPLIYALYKLAEEGEIDLAERVNLDPQDRVPGSGVLQHLDPGLQPTVRDLAELMIIVSDNYSTDLLYKMVGAERLAGIVQGLGLNQTALPHTTWQILCLMAGADPGDQTLSYADLRSLLRESGNASDERAATPIDKTDRSSPEDMVKLLSSIEDGDGISQASRDAIIDIHKHQNFNTMIPARLPDNPGIEVAHKTGSVTGVRNDVGIVYGPDVRYAIAIMSKDLQDTTEAVQQFALLSRWVWDHLAGLTESEQP